LFLLFSWLQTNKGPPLFSPSWLEKRNKGGPLFGGGWLKKRSEGSGVEKRNRGGSGWRGDTKGRVSIAAFVGWDDRPALCRNKGGALYGQRQLRKRSLCLAGASSWRRETKATLCRNKGATLFGRGQLERRNQGNKGAPFQKQRSFLYFITLPWFILSSLCDDNRPHMEVR